MVINVLHNWLSDCPYISAPVTVEYLEEKPGAVALFIEDTREISRRQDVVGNVWITCRSRFSLLRRVPRLSEDGGCAQWLLDLQGWIQKKSIRGEISQPYITHMQAAMSDGRLQEDTADGMGIYKVSLDVEYVKTYVAN